MSDTFHITDGPSFVNGELVNADALQSAWLKEIEAIISASPDSPKHLAFVIAGLRVAAKVKSLDKISITALAKISGYSRATFFRDYGKFHEFAIKSYQQTCYASALVYEKRLAEHDLSRTQFVELSGAILYGANVCIPNEVVARLWQSKDWAHLDFHPHLPQVAAVMTRYLRDNAETASLRFSDQEMLDAVCSLDRDILMSRLEKHSEFPSERQYKRLKAFLHGFILLHEEQ